MLRVRRILLSLVLRDRVTLRVTQVDDGDVVDVNDADADGNADV